MDPKRLVVIDGYSLLYRAFFATRYLSTSDGRPTNALFGFVQMLFTIIEREQPVAILVAMDAVDERTFRHDAYEAYKGTRRETPDELRVQLIAARELLNALSVPHIDAPGWEADDVVGTVSLRAEKEGCHTTIVTGDLDSLQLVDECVRVLTPGKGMTETVTYDPAAVVARYGFGPEHIADYKALKGDASDNIPGVPGIGDKGAAELITGFGTIEAMLERFDEIPEKFRKKIAGHEEQMRKSKWLATIVRDAPAHFDFRPLELTKEQIDEAVRFLDHYELRSAVKRAPNVLRAYLKRTNGGPAPTSEPFFAPEDEVAGEPALEVIDRGRVESLAEVDAMLAGRPFAALFATPAGKGLFAEAEERPDVMIAAEGEVWAVPHAVAEDLVQRFPSRATLHDAKPVYKRFVERSSGQAPAPPAMDTLLAAYVLRSERTTYPLRELATGYLEIAPPESPAEQAVALERLGTFLKERLEKEGQDRVLFEIELPLVPILAEMEAKGIRVNREGLREFSKTLEAEIAATQARIHEIAGRSFLIGSPKQLGEVLFDELKLPGAKATKTGYATGVEVLGELAAEHEIAAKVLSWRELTRLKTTYADALDKLVSPDGRIRTTYNQAVAATGRLSSENPNLQNIPIRTELGRGIRKAFIAEDGFRLASLDYSQIELRILAHMCGEPALVDAFRSGEDVHTATARTIFPDRDVTKETRRLAKMLNYAVLYGVSEFGLAQQLGVGFGVREAKDLIFQYNERFPSVREFMKGVIAEAKSKGFTTTLVGRRRYFPDIHAGKVQERKYSERQAMNAPIQGAAADMLKLAMIRCASVLKGADTRMLLNVHDELVFEVPDGEETVVPRLRAAMELALPLSVPVEVEAKLGRDWNTMTPIAD